MKKVISKQITFAFIALFAFGFSAFSQKVGVGTLTPTHGFHIVPKATIEPLRIDSLRSFQMNDTAILITNPTTGVVRYIAFSELDSIFDLNNSSSAIDTAFLNNYLLTIIEATDTSYIDLSSLGKNTNFIDSLMSSNYFTNGMYNMISDSLLLDQTWINALRDSLETDVDSVIIMNGDIIIYEGGNSISVNLHQIANDSNFIDSLLSSNYFNDSIYNTISNNLLIDSAWLQALKDSIETDVDSVSIIDGNIFIYEGGNSISVNLHQIANDSNFIDSLLSSNYFNDSIYNNISNNLLIDSAWLQAVKDSIETDVDSVSIENGNIFIYEGGNSISVNLYQIANDSNFIDSLLSSNYFNDSIYNNISNNLLIDSAWLQAVKDSIETDVDSVSIENGNIFIYEGGNSISVNLYQIANDTAFVDSLLSSNYFNDSIYKNISNDLLIDSAWLQAVKDSIETNVREIYQNGYTINIIEGNDTIVGILDSGEWFSDSDNDIYARRAYNAGNKIVITDNGRIGMGLDNPIGFFHIQSDLTHNPTADMILARATDLPKNDIDIDFYRSRGTISAPIAVEAGDRIGGVRFNGFDGDAIYTVGEISGEIDTSAGPLNLPFVMKFYTSQFGTVGDIYERMLINGYGRVGINTPIPTNLLHVTDTANPVRFSGLKKVTSPDTLVSMTSNGVLKYSTSKDVRTHAKFININASYSATVNDEVILVNAITPFITITLPNATTASGKTIIIKRVSNSANAVTVATAGGNIDGAATFTLTASTYNKIKVLSDGTNWWIID